MIKLHLHDLEQKSYTKAIDKEKNTPSQPVSATTSNMVIDDLLGPAQTNNYLPRQLQNIKKKRKNTSINTCKTDVR